MKPLLAVLVLAALAAGYLFWHPELRRDWFEGTLLAPSPVTAVYKWRDDSGAWQITSEPPPAGITYERLEYHRDTNIMPLAPRAD